MASRGRKLLVLDVNGLLVDRYFESAERPEEAADAKVNKHYVYKRPFCREFLIFCLENFVVGIWSSARGNNVTALVQTVFNEAAEKLAFCWGQVHCTFTKHRHPENHRKPLFFKELKLLWEKFRPELPWDCGEFGPQNTLLIDDSPYKAIKNPPHTAIFPRPYKAVDLSDDYLVHELQTYLHGLLHVEDVQQYVKDNPFGEPNISFEDPCWNFLKSEAFETTIKLPVAQAIHSLLPATHSSSTHQTVSELGSDDDHVAEVGWNARAQIIVDKTGRMWPSSTVHAFDSGNDIHDSSTACGHYNMTWSSVDSRSRHLNTDLTGHVNGTGWPTVDEHSHGNSVWDLQQQQQEQHSGWPSELFGEGSKWGLSEQQQRCSGWAHEHFCEGFKRNTQEQQEHHLGWPSEHFGEGSNWVTQQQDREHVGWAQEHGWGTYGKESTGQHHSREPVWDKHEKDRGWQLMHHSEETQRGAHENFMGCQSGQEQEQEHGHEKRPAWMDKHISDEWEEEAFERRRAHWHSRPRGQQLQPGEYRRGPNRHADFEQGKDRGNHYRRERSPGYANHFRRERDRSPHYCHRGREADYPNLSHRGNLSYGSYDQDRRRAHCREKQNYSFQDSDRRHATSRGKNRDCCETNDPNHRIIDLSPTRHRISSPTVRNNYNRRHSEPKNYSDQG